MNLNTFILIYWYNKYRQPQRISNRRFWVHPIVRQRNILSSFNTLMCQSRQDETKFFNYFRMSISNNSTVAQIKNGALSVKISNRLNAVSINTLPRISRIGFFTVRPKTIYRDNTE
jgi:hypothetical protein